MAYGIRIFGVPGSGKTTKCLEMLDMFLQKYEPSEIAYLSFTRAATYEAVKRAMEKFGFERKEMCWFRTIHSACFKLLELERDNILSEKDIKRFCKLRGVRYKTEGERALDDERSILRPTKYPDVEGNFLIDFSNKLRNFTCKEVRELSEDEVRMLWARLSPQFAPFVSHVRIYDFLVEFEEYKERIGKFDYTDMLINVLKQKMCPPVRVVINDEAQDNTPLQGKIIGMWCKQADKYVLAGDWDQCLYHWSGSDPGWFLNFPVDEEIILSESFRVPQNIIEVAALVIKRNKQRKDITPRGRSCKGTLRILMRPKLTDLLLLSKTGETNYFLFRTNYFEDMFCNELLQFGIPFRRLLRTTPWTKKIVNIHNALVKFARGEKVTYDEAKAIIENVPTVPFLKKGLKKTFQKEYMANMTFSENDLVMLGVSPYRLPLKDRNQVITALRVSNTAKEALKKARPMIIDKIPIITGTIHASKGLEADNIFIFVDYPSHIRKITEEERRIFYVAITRCRERVFLVKNYFTHYCLLWGEIVEAVQKARKKQSEEKEKHEKEKNDTFK